MVSYGINYGLKLPGRRDIMTASLQSSQRRSVLAMNIASLNTTLVTAKDDNKLYGLEYHNASGMA